MGEGGGGVVVCEGNAESMLSDISVNQAFV